ncbi:MAG: ABC transporter substrate-binding protein [Bacteriovoracales bacterium]|nr:ABC transporter substrate-binding protein [Bacteriovoracales bacterium]
MEKRLQAFLALALWLTAQSPKALALEESEGLEILPTQGVSEREILFGQSAALSGPAKNLGLDMRSGILAAFHEVNERGGIRGRKLKLVTKDDAYEAVPAKVNTRHLLTEEKVFAFIGGVGTPTSKAVLPIIAQTPLLYLGPFTGASLLRTSYLKTVINVRASYAQETQKMVQHLKNDLNIERIGVFYQSDSYGRDGFDGVQKAIDETEGIEIVSSGAYMRNSTAVQSGVLEIHRGNPQAVIIIGSYAPAATFIRWVEKLGILDKSTVFMAVSFVGTSSLAKELQKSESKANVFATQIVPDHLSDSKLAKNYTKAMEKIGLDRDTNVVSLEGYVVGRLAAAALERIEGEITHENFSLAFRDHIFDIDGFRLAFDGADDNQGSNEVFFTEIARGKAYSIETPLKIREES